VIIDDRSADPRRRYRKNNPLGVMGNPPFETLVADRKSREKGRGLPSIKK
jgi:hypothetical protein